MSRLFKSFAIFGIHNFYVFHALNADEGEIEGRSE
jgi:hypothetical protein